MILPASLLIFEAAIFGLIVGSFLNVCIYRLPQGLSLLGRSFCPTCKKPIPLYRNIPLLTFLSQGGKSACCHKPISWQYPIVEAITGMLSVITFLHSQSLPQYFLWFVLFMCPLIVVSMIDFELKIIPDCISIPFIVIGILVQQYEQHPQWLSALKFSGLGILIGGGSLWLLAELVTRIKKRDAMGGGDIKLTAMLGAFLGWKGLIFVFFVSSVMALMYGLFKLAKKSECDKTIPFGPFLSLAAMMFWLYGRYITNWYFVSVMKLGFNPLY